MEYPAPQLLGVRDFRIMHLQLGNSDDAIRFSLQLTTCEADPQIHYEALSYAWGDLALTHEIFCEGVEHGAPRSMMVTTNCFNALKSLRLRDKTRTLWIDAICINQEDLKERASQVSIMQSIYRGACQVVVYLGEAADDSESVMRYIHDCDSPFDYPRENTTVPNPNTEAWQSFFSRPWFTRIWVLQEVINAQYTELRCGAVSIPWAALDHHHSYYQARPNRDELRIPVADAVLRYLRNTKHTLHEELSSFQFWSTEQSQKRETSGSKGLALKLLELLELTRSCLSSDPRDKVYGILPMLGSFEDTAILKPDYHRPAVELYVDLALFLYGQFGAEVLRQASKVRCQDGLAMLPTWVPDWTSAHVYGLDQDNKGTRLGSYVKRFQAGGKRQAWPRPYTNPFVFESLTRRLHLKGVRIGSMVTLSDECNLDEDLFPLSQWRNTALGPSDASDGRFANIPEDDLEVHPEGAFQRMLTYDRVVYPRALCRGLNMIIEWERGKVPNVLVKNIYGWSAGSYERQMRRILECCDKRKLGVLQNGMLSLVPVHAEISDLVYVLPGTSVPFLFRKQGDHHVFVGECYVQGIMHGEAWEGTSDDSLELLVIE